MTSQEQKSAQSVDHDIPDTEVIVVSEPSPVFVDFTGRRRRLLRRLSYAFGGVCMLYGGLVSVSLAGGPVSSRAILPLPDLGNEAATEVLPSPTPRPTIGSPKARAIIEALPRHDLPAAGNDRLIATRPGTAPTAVRAKGKPATPKPRATSSKPVESTATPTPSASPSTSGSPSPSTSATSGPTNQPSPVNPVPPKARTAGGSTSSGSGGSTSSGSGGSTSSGSGGSAFSGSGWSTSGGSGRSAFSGSGGSASSGSGGVSAMPAPPAEAPTTDVADATPSPAPQTPVPGDFEFSATGDPGGGSSIGTKVPA